MKRYFIKTSWNSTLNRYRFDLFILVLTLFFFFQCAKKYEIEPVIPKPSILSIEPNAGKKNTIVKIQGKNFSDIPDSNRVEFNGKIALVTAASDTMLTAVVPENAGSGNVSVTTPAGLSVGPTFTYVEFNPAILNIEPVCGRTENILSIEGLNFSPDPAENAVFINNVQATIISSTETVIEVAVPFSGAGGAVTLVVGGETATGPVFNFMPTGLVSIYINDLSAGGITTDGEGIIYTAEPFGHRIIKAYPNGERDVVAGNSDAPGFYDANGQNASFYYPQDVAIDSKGNLFVTDYSNNCIRKIAPNGDVSLYAGHLNPLIGLPEAGNKDGVRTEALFNSPIGITIDENDNLYVCDAGNYSIRKISPDDGNGMGVVTTVAGRDEYGDTDGPANEASFGILTDLIVDPSGNIFIVDLHDFPKIRKVSFDGIVSTLAYGPYELYMDCKDDHTLLNLSGGIALDASGNLHVSIFVEENNYKLITISPHLYISTLAGGNPNGAVEGLGDQVQFSEAKSMTFSNDVVYVVADNKIMKVELK